MSPNRTLIVSAALAAFVLVIAGAVASRLVHPPVPSAPPQQAAPERPEPESVPVEMEIATPTRHEKHGHHHEEHHHHHDDHGEDDDG